MTIEEALKALDNPKSVTFKDLLKICEIFFGDFRIKGSHHIFKTLWQGPTINIQPVGKMAKPYQVRQISKALEKLKEMIVAFRNANAQYAIMNSARLPINSKTRD